MKKMKLILVLFLLVSVARAQEKPVVLKQGDVVPDFTVTDTSGVKTSLLKLASQSKYTLVDFWSSSCGPCRAAFPELKKVYAKWHTKGFNIMGVANDKESNWKKALAEDKTTWLHGLDSEKSIHKLFSVQGVPAYLLVNSKGKLVAASMFTGGRMLEFGIPIRDAAGLDAGLEKLLNEAK